MRAVIMGIAANVLIEAAEFITVFEKPITVSIQIVVGGLTIAALIRQHRALTKNQNKNAKIN